MPVSARSFTAIMALALWFAGTGSPVEAQQSADPSQIERRIEQSRPEIKRADPKINLPEAAPVEPAKPDADRFVLAAVVIEGATVFDPAIFAPYYEKLLAQEITLADVETILARITKKYRDDGYILSRAIAPPQELSAGVLRIDIVEGYINEIEYRGVKEREDILAPYVARLQADRPLRLSTLERYILLINDISGIGIDPRLRPVDEAKGQYALVLTVNQKKYDGLAYLNNRGTPSAGRLQGWLSAGLNSMLGLRERFQLGFFTTPNQPKELLYYEASYTQPIGSDGFHVSLLASTSDLDSGSELKATEVESGSSRAQLRAWYPVLRSSKENLWATGSLIYQDFRETSFDVTTTADRTRVMRLGLNYWLAHHKGSTSVSVEGSQGFNILDATEQGSDNLSRVDGRSDFTKFTAFVTRVQGIGNSFGLQASVGAQWSAHPLLSGEEFAVGGTAYGRGYDFSEVTGDIGAAASLEFRYGKNVGKAWLNAFQLYTFFDIGSVWNDVPGQGNFRDSVSSTGLGTRITVKPNFRVNLEIAKPLTREVDTRDSTSTRYFFNVTASF